MSAARAKGTNLLDVARQRLEAGIAEDACKVAALDRRIAELKHEATLVGYERVAARADLRVAVAKLESHDLQRRRPQ